MVGIICNSGLLWNAVHVHLFLHKWKKQEKARKPLAALPAKFSNYLPIRKKHQKIKQSDYEKYRQTHRNNQTRRPRGVNWVWDAQFAVRVTGASRPDVTHRILTFLTYFPNVYWAAVKLFVVVLNCCVLNVDQTTHFTLKTECYPSLKLAIAFASFAVLFPFGSWQHSAIMQQTFAIGQGQLHVIWRKVINAWACYGVLFLYSLRKPDLC